LRRGISILCRGGLLCEEVIQREREKVGDSAKEEKSAVVPWAIAVFCDKELLNLYSYRQKKQ